MNAPHSASPTKPAVPLWDRRALFQRLQTYRPSTWFAKPAALSPEECALRGWRNIGPDRLACDGCASKIVCNLPHNPASDSFHTAVDRYQRLLTDSHDGACQCKRAAVPRSLLSFPPATTEKLLADLTSRSLQLQQLDYLPGLEPTALVQLAVAAQQSCLLPDLVLTLGLRESQAAALTQNLGPVPELQQQEQQHRPASPHATSPAARARCSTAIASPATPLELTSAQAANLLALCGWQLQQLAPTGSAAAAAAAPPLSAFALAHLTGSGGAQPRPQQQHPPPAAQQQKQRVSSSHAALCCGLCGSSAGLWQYSCSGPLYLRAITSKAHQVATCGPEQLVQQLAAPPPLTGAEREAGDAAGAAGAAASAAGSVAAADVAASLHRTIAGGDLLAAAAAGCTPGAGVPRAPFGSRSVSPVFGLHVLNPEPGRQPQRDQGHAFPPPHAGSMLPAATAVPSGAAAGTAAADVAAAEASGVGGQGGEPCAKRARLDSAGSGGGTIALGTASAAGAVTAAATAGSAAAAAAAAGTAAAVAASSPPRPVALQPASSIGRQHSSAGDLSLMKASSLSRELSLVHQHSQAAAGAAGTQPEVIRAPRFDPVAAHRPWCPWVHPVRRATDGGGGAGTGTGSVATSAGGNGAPRMPLSGALTCLMCVQEQREMSAEAAAPGADVAWDGTLKSGDLERRLQQVIAEVAMGQPPMAL